MEVLYQGFLQKKISEGALQDLTAHPEALETLALQQTAKVCFGSDNPEAVSANGKLWLAAQVAHKYIAGVLRYDLRRLRSSPFVIAGLERLVSGTIEFGTGTGRHRAQLRGIVDRIDLAPDGAMIVADYKSGHFENKLLALSSIDALFGEAGGQRREIFQGLLYSFMLQGESPNARIEPAFYFLQNIYHPDFDHRITIEGAPVTDVKPLLPQFAEGLQGLLTRIFDPQEDFCQTPDPKTCLHCEFADICSRR